VAGIAAAATDNGRGVAGTAPAARLIVVRALRHSCGVPGVASTCTASGTAADVEAGIRWAADRGATVINLSIGDTAQSVLGPAFAEALRYAWAAGSIPVVAAGNDIVLSSGFRDEPAVVVSAVARDGQAASYSNGVGEARWALAAPGGESERDTSAACGNDGPPNGILSTFFQGDRPDVKYACQAGTSMAAPHVAGALAILRSAGLSPQEAVDRLLATAADRGRPGRDATYGAGLLDLAKAVEGLPGTGGAGGAGAGGGGTGGCDGTGGGCSGDGTGGVGGGGGIGRAGGGTGGAGDGDGGDSGAGGPNGSGGSGSGGLGNGGLGNGGGSGNGSDGGNGGNGGSGTRATLDGRPGGASAPGSTMSGLPLAPGAAPPGAGSTGGASGSDGGGPGNAVAAPTADPLGGSGGDEPGGLLLATAVLVLAAAATGTAWQWRHRRDREALTAP
jgi:hypothetical protein